MNTILEHLQIIVTWVAVFVMITFFFLSLYLFIKSIVIRKKDEKKANVMRKDAIAILVVSWIVVGFALLITPGLPYPFMDVFKLDIVCSICFYGIYLCVHCIAQKDKADNVIITEDLGKFVQEEDE